MALRRWSLGRLGRGVAAAWPLVGLLAAMGVARPAAAQEMVGVAGLGAFSVRPNEDSEFVLDLEYRLAARSNKLVPVIGAAATSDGATYLRLGIGRDFPFSRGWNTHLGFGVSSYFEGPDGMRLGSALEFRSVIDVSYQVTRDLRIGVALAHLSNGGLGEFNPGVETLCLTFGWTEPHRRRHAP